MVPQPKGSLTTPPMEDPNETNVSVDIVGVEPPTKPFQQTQPPCTSNSESLVGSSVPVPQQHQQVEPQPQKLARAVTTELVPDQQKEAVSRTELPTSSTSSTTQCAAETLSSITPQQEHQQQSLSAATTKEEQTEAPPKPLATAEPTSTSATAAALCAIATHCTTVPQKQHQHILSFATIQADQQKPLPATEPTRSSAAADTLKSSTPQQEHQQSLLVATTEEQKEATPKLFETAEATSTSATAAAALCAIAMHCTTVPQQQQHQQQQHQHQHIPSFATIQAEQQKALPATELTRSAAAAATANATSSSTEAPNTNAPQQPSAQPSVVMTEPIRNPVAGIDNSLASHVNTPSLEAPRNSDTQQLKEKGERDEHKPRLVASAVSPDRSANASCTTENPESSVSQQQQQQQQNENENENEKEGEQHEPPAATTEPILYPDPTRYIIAGVGTSTPCNVHRPTLEELKAQSFSDFVRHKVLAAASRFLPFSDDDGEQDKNEINNKDEKSKEEVATTATTEPEPAPTPIPPVAVPEPPRSTGRKVALPERYRMDKAEEKVHVVKKKTNKHNDDVEEPEEEEWTQGMGKVSLPLGFCTREGIAGDETARGPAWQAGAPLGDIIVQQPIQQNLRGLAGTYEYTFTVQQPMTMAAFRDKADAYRKAQVGSEMEPLEDLTPERLTALERTFWRRLGPTMPPAWYGADQEGTFFGDDPAMGWSIGNLDSLLHILSRVPGVTSPYLYAGMFASVFCAHTEDMNLLSINYLHAGAPKIWYAVAPGPDAARFEALAEFQYSVESKACKEFLRHKRCLMSPRVLQKAGIRYTTTVQMPGEAVITFPGGYHFGFNTGFNVAEATNFGVAEWLPFGRRAKVCLCRPDSVRIDLYRLTALLRLYNADKRKEPTLTWKVWGRRKEEEDNLKKEKAERKRIKGADSPPGKSSPKSKGKGSKKSPKTKLSEQQRKQEFWVEVMRAVTSSGKTQTAAKGKSKRKRKQEKIVESEEDVWHLARPVGRKRLELHTRVLCIVPATVMSSKRSKAKSKVDIDDEQCFSGQVVEMADDCVRVHLDGTPKSEDTWMYTKSAKLFLDGGRWSDEEEDEVSEIPPKHYWQEVDSKRLCVEK
jgi:hypothetical protein